MIKKTIFAIILSAFLLWPGNRAEDSRPVGKGVSNQKIVETPNASAKTNHPQTASSNPSQKSNSLESGIEESVSARNKPEELNDVRSENTDTETTQQKEKAISIDVQQDQDKLNELIAKRDQLLKNQKSDNSTKKPEIVYPKQILDSTLFIDLRRKALENLGFVSKKNSIELRWLFNESKVFTIYKDNRLIFGLEFDDVPQPKTDSDNPYSKINIEAEQLNVETKRNVSVRYNEGILPMLVTDEKGKALLKISLPESELKALFSKDFSRDFKTLLPVVMRKNIFGNLPKEDVIYWFLPTDQFFNRLPRAVSKELLAEYKYVTAEDKSKLVQPECKYFEECENTLNHIKFKVFPNPASTQVYVSFSLNEAINGRITLVDLAGRERQVLKPQTKFAIGPHQINVDVSAVPEGIYLITLYSDKGIQTQRLIVTR